MNIRGCEIVMVLATICTVRVDASAIPMWEFLSRHEKMSQLYRLVSTQVVDYCQDSSMPDCTKNLLMSGLRQLATMDDNELERLDPYQRNADDRIWRAVIGDNLITSPVHQEKQDNHYTTDSDPLATSDHNSLAEESAHTHDFVRPSEESGPYLVGPMVIRVFPDGRPVPEDKNRPLPQDEDLEEFKYPRLPSISEIESGRQMYKKPYNLRKRTSVTKPSHFSIFNAPYYRPNLSFRRIQEPANSRIFSYSK